MGLSVSFQYLYVGQCQHLECLCARGGRKEKIDFPALCGLIHHPDVGWILFDTGYSNHFFEETQNYPERLYRTSLPVQLPEQQYLIIQLAQKGIKPEEIKLIIVSHYHGDHISGLKDFPNARFIASKIDSEKIQRYIHRRWRATSQGKLPGLLPDNYFNRLTFVEEYPVCALPKWMAPFLEGIDILGDGSLLLVYLPGHSKGQLGLLMPDANGRPVFLVSDACWSLPACLEGRLPSRLTYFFIENINAYKNTFNKVQMLGCREKEIVLLPSHCKQSWSAFLNE